MSKQETANLEQRIADLTDERDRLAAALAKETGVFAVEVQLPTGKWFRVKFKTPDMAPLEIRREAVIEAMQEAVERVARAWFTATADAQPNRSGIIIAH